MKPQIHYIIQYAVLGTLLVLLTACTAAQPAGDSAGGNSAAHATTAFPYTFTDATGNIITLQGRPRTVAVLFSSYADIWQSAGGEISITVGESIERGFASDTCILVDDKSGHTTIDTELLIASKPDLVIGTADYDVQRQVVKLCTENNIPAALFRVETFTDYLSMLKICTDITGNSESYLEHGTKVGQQIDHLLAQVAAYQASPRNILFVRAGTSAKSTKAKTAQDNFVCAMLKELNTYNIAENAPVLLDGLSLEEILVCDPEHIFITTMGNENAAKDYMNSVLSDTGWKELTAVAGSAYTYLPKDLFHYKPNSRWYEAYLYLTKILYPEIKID